MGKGTDKLYITHSEWASEDAFSASAGSGVSKSKDADTTFKRLPFNFCAVSLQPFIDPVCTVDGNTFDAENIQQWIGKHDTNPVSGHPLKIEDLIKLDFAKNDEGDFVDPVTFKVFTNNTHIVALGNTGHVFAYDTIERLNIKPKMWRDLVSDEPFTRKDVITLQDPQNLQSRNLSSFKYIKDGESTLTPEQERQRNAGVNKSALGNAASILKDNKTTSAPPTSSAPKVGKYLNQGTSSPSTSLSTTTTVATKNGISTSTSIIKPPLPTPKPKPKSHLPTSHHTTGRAAASFTSTGLTPDTSSSLTTLTDEEYLLRPRTIKSPAYITISIPPHGTLTLELRPDYAPRATWNMIQLSKKGYYNNALFHRNIRSFMLQGGDPTGTGRGGSSIWGGIFPDEIVNNPLSHDARGVVSMANKGKDTNTSQFFITYNPCKHLDRKHTVFGKVVEGWETLKKIEGVEVTEKEKRPVKELRMEEVNVLVDPFENFLRERDERARREEEEEDVRRRGGREDDRTTWTGKRVRVAGEAGVVVDEGAAPAVGKYLSGSTATGGDAGGGDGLEEWEAREPAAKKKKVVNASGGFGNFDGW